MAIALSEVAAGSILKINENGTPEDFIVLENDHYGTGTGVTLLRKDVYGIMALGEGLNISNPSIYTYLGSFIDNFCNSTYLYMLDSKIRDVIVPVKIPVQEGVNSASVVTIQRKGFSLSKTECGGQSSKQVGSAFTWLKASAQNRTAKRSGALSGSKYYSAQYWLRSMDTSGLLNFDTVNAAGAFATLNYATYIAGARPAFQVPSSIVVDVTEDGTYAIESLPSESGNVWIKRNGNWEKVFV